MEKEIIFSKEEKKLATIYSFLDNYYIEDKSELLNKILKDLPKINSCGYAGYISKDYLKTQLDCVIFPKKKLSKCCLNKTSQIILEINQTLERCKNYLGDEELSIFIFPTFDFFIKEKMFGNSGFTSWKNTIHLYINEFNQGRIASTLVHEIAHALSPYSLSEKNSIGTILVYEGIADKFCEEILKNSKNPWSKSITKKEAIKVKNNLDLESDDYQLYLDLFFGSDKFKLWSGYSLGDLMAEEILKEIKNKDWFKIIRSSPKELQNL